MLIFDKKQFGRPPEDPHDFLFQKFTTELALDETQKTVLKSLLDVIKEKHHQIRRDNRKKYKTIQEEFDRNFREILTEEQLIKYDLLVKEFEEALPVTFPISLLI